jgi:UDP-glucose 4-epimerase
VPIPYTLAKFGVRRLWSLRMTNFPAPELDFVRYVCMVDDRRAREMLGYQPAFDIDQTLNAVDEERWLA